MASYQSLNILSTPDNSVPLYHELEAVDSCIVKYFVVMLNLNAKRSAKEKYTLMIPSRYTDTIQTYRETTSPTSTFE